MADAGNCIGNVWRRFCSRCPQTRHTMRSPRLAHLGARRNDGIPPRGVPGTRLYRVCVGAAAHQVALGHSGAHLGGQGGHLGGRQGGRETQQGREGGGQGSAAAPARAHMALPPRPAAHSVQAAAQPRKHNTMHCHPAAAALRLVMLPPARPPARHPPTCASASAGKSEARESPLLRRDTASERKTDWPAGVGEPCSTHMRDPTAGGGHSRGTRE